MSVVSAARKNNEIAICADSQLTYGSLTVSAAHLKNSSKLYEVNDSVLGIVGWCAITTVIEHLIENDPEVFRLRGRMEILSTVLKLHELMKDSYFLETHECRDQPVESMQLHALIINSLGMFEINSYREVNEFGDFWAIGSGNRLALGAMHALYDGASGAREIAESGVRAAAEFDENCGLPLNSGVVCGRQLKAVVL